MIRKYSRPLILLIPLMLLQDCPDARADDKESIVFPSFADHHTVALWLFDETEYPGTTLTDAGTNRYDLRLLAGGTLVAGRFGNALKVLRPESIRPDNFYERFPKTPGIAVCYLSSPGDSRDQVRAVLGGNSPPTSLVSTLRSPAWTCEFWLKLASRPAANATLIDLGQGLAPGFRIDVDPDAESFIVSNAAADASAIAPTDVALLCDGAWHHVAFTHSPTSGVRHFLDGNLHGVQRTERYPWPKSTADSRPLAWSEELQNRFNLSLGHSRTATQHVDGAIDEVRISDIVRYSGEFEPPGSFSRVFDRDASQPTMPNGPPLLFGEKQQPGPIRLGSRKHLFIDDVLIEQRQGVKLVPNPPSRPRQLQPPKMDLPGDLCVFDHDGMVWMMPGWISADGVNFKESFRVPVREGAVIFEDGNPLAGPEERYKLTAATTQGVYLYLSPDGVHWRRNETCMLPLVSGGSCESYWDDQRGSYVSFIKRDGSFHTPEYPRGGRSAPMFETREPLKPWPFKRLKRPYYEGWAYPCVTGEGPVVIDKNENGQVYRTRAIKYPWAPDVYLAFAWRLPENQARQTDLGVSRDGIHWRFFAPSWYLAAEGEFEDNPIVEALAHSGFIRRGDEIWQYASYGYKPHTSGDAYVRLTQRLDGFVSFDAENTPGTLTTRPLIFEGNRLSLNVDADGSAAVAVLEADGAPFPGFGLEDCDAIKTDSTRHVVSWRGDANLNCLAGKVVKLQIRMRKTKLYAFQFEASDGSSYHSEAGCSGRTRSQFSTQSAP